MPEQKTSSIVKTLTAATVGTTLEWYDFFIAALSATVVWPTVFFPTLRPGLALAASLSSYVVTFISRPLGGYVFGHFGDRLGRKYSFLLTLALMGIASFGIAVVPSYDSIGILAPAFIIIFRIVFGFGIGGEWGGASSLVLESAPNSKHKGFLSGWVNAGLGFGAGLGAGVFALTSTYLHSILFTIGWRIPFVIGGIVVIIGMLIVHFASESQALVSRREKGEISKAPANEVLKKYWKKIVLLGFAYYYTTTIVSGVAIAFVVPFLIIHHFTPAFAYSTVVVWALGMAVGAISGAAATDYISVKKTAIIGGILVIAFIFPYTFMIQTLNTSLIYLASFILAVFTDFGAGGPMVRLFAGSFETKYRYSGGGLVFQFGAAYGAILLLVFPLIGAQKGGIYAIYMDIIVIISVLVAIVYTIFLKYNEVEYT